MSKYKMFMVEMDISGKGYIEVLAKDEAEAKKKVKEGFGIQRCDHWECDEIFLDTIEDQGEVGAGDLVEYQKESGESLE